jgi:hypothetical protein
MVTLNKQHLLSTCKVKIRFSSFNFLTLFFGKKPNNEYYMPPIVIILKLHFASTIS